VLCEIVQSHYPRKKWFVQFWMCDFIVLTRSCKLISFFTFNICCFITKFNKAYRMPNILRVTWLRHTPLPQTFYHARSAFQRRSYVPNVKSPTQAVLKICLIICQKFRGHVTSHAPFGESDLCIQSALNMRSYWPNLKSVAQIIFKIFGIVCHKF